MSIHVTITRATPAHQPRPGLAKAWRRWWQQAANRRQVAHLHDITQDPHIARDLGLPIREKTAHRVEFW